MIDLEHDGLHKLAHSPRPPIQASAQNDNLRRCRTAQFRINRHSSRHHHLRLSCQVLVTEPRTPFLGAHSSANPVDFRLLPCGQQRHRCGITEGSNGSPPVRNGAPHAYDCCCLTCSSWFHADQCASTDMEHPTFFGDVSSLFPPSIVLLHREDFHERFDGMDLAVITLNVSHTVC